MKTEGEYAFGTWYDDDDDDDVAGYYYLFLLSIFFSPHSMKQASSLCASLLQEPCGKEKQTIRLTGFCL